MDWTTLFSSVLISGSLFGILSYFLKKSLDESLALFFETVKEERKGRIQEELRRQAMIFDRQSETLSTAMALVYRIRNAVRDLSEVIETMPSSTESVNSGDDGKASRESIEQIRRRIQTYYRALDELLFEERAYFPEAVFSFAHGARHIIGELDMLVASASRGKRSRDLQQHKEHVRRVVERLNTIYEHLVPIVQNSLGVVKGA